MFNKKANLATHIYNKCVIVESSRRQRSRTVSCICSIMNFRVSHGPLLLIFLDGVLREE